jgi:predicted enzyme related to lactoylglutathione lyase
MSREGTPIWIDLMVPSVDHAIPFYKDLFAWEIEKGTAEMGFYSMASTGGKLIAGLGQYPEGNPAPPAWSVYLQSDKLEDTLKKVKAHGGSVILEPMDVMTAGRMAIAADPTGAVFGLWQPGEHKGVQTTGEQAGAPCWYELLSQDAAKAKKFYVDVFGYQTEDMDMGPYTYTIFSFEKKGERTGFAGLGEVPDGHMPSHWSPYITVTDADATTAKAEALGGKVIMHPETRPYGRHAVIQDNQDAKFNILVPNPDM